MHLRRRSSAASATLASRTKPTTPTTSRRSSSRLGLMCKRGEDYSPLFLRAFYEVSERGKYEIPAPNLRVPGSGTLGGFGPGRFARANRHREPGLRPNLTRSEEHTSELQSPCNLVCRPL